MEIHQTHDIHQEHMIKHENKIKDQGIPNGESRLKMEPKLLIPHDTIWISSICKFCPIFINNPSSPSMRPRSPNKRKKKL